MTSGISVLMPARNAENSIGAAVRSTLSALGPHDELIVGLHKCSDATEAIVKKLAVRDRRLRAHEVRAESFSAALNELISQASRPLIGRMDADDICLPWRFQIQRSLFSDGHLDFLFGTAVIGFPIGRLRLLVPQRLTSLNNAQIGSLLRGVNPLVHPSMLARTDSLRVLLGYRDVPGEDLDLWLRASNAGMKLKRHWLPTVIYNMSPGQLSRQAWYKTGWQESDLIFQERRKLAKKIGRRQLTLLEKLEILGLPQPSSLNRLNAFSGALQTLD